MNELNGFYQQKIIYRNKHNSEQVIKRCGQVLNQDQVAVIPTDTVYGLSGNYFSGVVRERISQIKQRPPDKGFIVLLPNVDFLVDFADQEIPNVILGLIPASLTLIVKNKHRRLHGEETLAIRVPDDPWLSLLLKEADIPLISTSANISGMNMPKTNQELITLFQEEVDLLVLEESIRDSEPSTILDISARPYKILRQGSFIVDIPIEFLF